MSAAVFDLLPDFGTPPEGVRPPATHATPADDAANPLKPQADIGTLIAEAVAEAETALAVRLEQEHRTQLEAERRACAEEKAAFLEMIGGDVGQAVAVRMSQVETTLGELAGATVARVLGGMLSDDLQRRSLQALAGTIANATKNAGAVRIRVSGPTQMFESLSAALGELASNLDFTDAPGLDLTVAVDDVVFETHMAEWSQALSEILA
jgi:hypothetical protein